MVTDQIIRNICVYIRNICVFCLDSQFVIHLSGLVKKKTFKGRKKKGKGLIRTGTLFDSFYNYWNRKKKSTKQTVKILIRSCLVRISTVCKCVSEFTWCPKFHDFTLL